MEGSTPPVFGSPRPETLRELLQQGQSVLFLLPDVLSRRAVELVVVHELCHLREMNHGPGFYALLERYLSDWKERKSCCIRKRRPTASAFAYLYSIIRSLVITDQEHGLDGHDLVIFLLRDLHIGVQGLPDPP